MRILMRLVYDLSVRNDPQFAGFCHSLWPDLSIVFGASLPFEMAHLVERDVVFYQMRLISGSICMGV